MPLPDARLYLLFTPDLCRLDPWRTLAAALQSGVDLVQWRTKRDDPGGFQRCRDLCQRAAVPLLVNDDVMLAVRSRSAGAHVGQDDIPADAARKLLGHAWLGVSTHDADQIAAAAAAGADYVGFGPCFPTTTKGYAEALDGPTFDDGLAAAAAARLPLFAIGGITAANLPLLRARGVDRIAVSSAVLQHDDPADAVATLRRWL